MLTDGQHAALSELKVVESRTGGKVRAGAVAEEWFAGEAIAVVQLVIDCVGTPMVAQRGVDLGREQVFRILIPPDYPYVHPYVEATHDGFAELPHVLWNRGICLYTSPNDWEPSTGMPGFVGRLLTWLERSAAGSLVRPALPWHPPLGSGRLGLKPVVIRDELPEAFDRDEGLWTCWASVTPVGDEIFEVRSWHGAATEVTASAMPLIGLPRPVGFRFPERTSDLMLLLGSQGMDSADFRRLVRRAWDANGTGEVVVLVGSPAPAAAGSSARIANITAWLLKLGSEDGADLDEVLDRQPAHWAKVYDQRPSRVTLRNVTRPVTWLAGKRILVLGCGALGGPIAEHCVRAGVAALSLVDSGTVTPGILVRQPYRHSDIGMPKAIATAHRLREIAPDVDVSECDVDATRLDFTDLDGFDLVIDATANRGVSERLEVLRRKLPSSPSAATMAVMVGHRCERAAATIALPSGTGGCVDVQRRLALAAFDRSDLADLWDDFYPDEPRTRLFQPEPGCSDPTFVGSSADLGNFAATLLNCGLTVLASADTAPADAMAGTSAAVVVRQWDGLDPPRPPQLLQWPNDVLLHDATSGYQIRVAPAAWACMRSEAIRASHLDRGQREAGGLLIGQIDPACKVVWVSTALAATADDATSAGQVLLEFDRMREPLRDLFRRTKGMLGFVGLWHNHPDGVALPSQQDHATMAGVVNRPDGGVSAALIMILGGDGNDQWNTWLRGAGLPSVYAGMYFLGMS
jgi:hypothetical protein